MIMSKVKFQVDKVLHNQRIPTLYNHKKSKNTWKKKKLYENILLRKKKCHVLHFDPIHMMVHTIRIVNIRDITLLQLRPLRLTWPEHI